MNNVMYEKYSIKQSEISFPPPIGCVYNLTREQKMDLLFNNTQLEYASSFKEKKEKETAYKIKVEKKKADDGTGVAKYGPASTYKGKFDIKMTSTVPNYDFTVYNMKTEP